MHGASGVRDAITVEAMGGIFARQGTAYKQESLVDIQGAGPVAGLLSRLMRMD